ncbi:hypothetical protein FRC17_000702, partial [Serendipita sp. 399]
MPKQPERFPTGPFDEIVQRARLLRATVRESNYAYVNQKTLTLPMPQLQCLVLTYERTGFYFGPKISFETWKQINKWFGGVTHQLKELYLSQIHPQWDDKIFTNLTHLQLNSPHTTTRPSRLLRILSLCPTMEYLDIVNCFSQPPKDHSADVSTDTDSGDDGAADRSSLVVMRRLLYLHFDDSESHSFSSFLSRIVCPVLETMIICARSMASIISFVDTLALQDTSSQASNGSGTRRPVPPLKLVRYHQIETVELAGHLCFEEKFYNDLFSSCSQLKCLKLEALQMGIPGNEFQVGRRNQKNTTYYMSPSAVIVILSGVIKATLCPYLIELHLQGHFETFTRQLIQWLRSRAGEQRRLRRLVVYRPYYYHEDQKPLPARSRSQIEDLLEEADPTDQSKETRLVWGYSKALEYESDMALWDIGAMEPEER